MQRLTLKLAAGLTLAMCLGSCDHRERVRAYGAPPEVVTYSTAVPQAAVAPAPGLAPGQLDEGQLDQLLAPVALYPDPLVAQVLPAATYPDDVADAATWLKNHPEADDGDIDRQSWEPSVKALAHYPEALQMLNDHPEWMQALGAAVLNQQADVMASIQRLRQQAVAVKTLQDTPEQQVVVEQGAIEILPADPEVIYVPVYDPVVVYDYCPAWPPIVFRHHYHVGVWLDYSCDWHSRVVVVGGGWHYGWRHDGHRWHPDQIVGRDGRNGRTGVRDGRDGIRNSRDGRDTRVGTSGRDTRTVATWSHNNAKPRPTLPPALLAGGTSGRTPAGETPMPRTADKGRTLGATSGRQYKPFALPVREGGTASAKPAVAARVGPGTPAQATVITPTPRLPSNSVRDTTRDGRDTPRDARNAVLDTRRGTAPEVAGKTAVRSNALPLPSTVRKMPSDIPAAPPALLSQSTPTRRDWAVTPADAPTATPSRVGPTRPDIRLAPVADPRSITLPAPKGEPAPRQISVPTPRLQAAPREITLPAPRGEPARTFTPVPQVRSSQGSDSVRERSVEIPRAAERSATVRSSGADNVRASSPMLRASDSAGASGRAGNSDTSRSRGGNSSDDDGGSRSGRR